MSSVLAFIGGALLGAGGATWLIIIRGAFSRSEKMTDCGIFLGCRNSDQPCAACRLATLTARVAELEGLLREAMIAATFSPPSQTEPDRQS